MSCKVIIELEESSHALWREAGLAVWVAHQTRVHEDHNFPHIRIPRDAGLFVSNILSTSQGSDAS